MKRLLLVALMALMSLVGMVGFSSADNEVSALQASANATNEAVSTLQATVNDGVPASAKKYYLTVTSFTGGDVLTACDSGFHMANISEIQDHSNLQYATRSTPAYDAPAYDQGFGPPLNHMGWVRPGAYMQTDFGDSCDVSQSSSDQQSSTTMSLYSFWFDAKPFLPASAPMSRWHMAQHTCSQPEPVWCVEDPD